MPNRIIKESVCYSEDINKMSWFEECFFHRLWTHCDDFGRMDARPAILKAKLFPLKERLSLKDIQDALKKLADIGCVRLYECDSKPYLYLPKWEVHQSIRAKRSKYPDPNNLYTGESTCEQLQSNVPDIQSNPNPKTNPPTAQELEDFFESLWKLYPNKKGKGSVSTTTKRKLHKIGYETMAIAIERYRQEIESKCIDIQFVKHGSTFFNSGYLDYISDDWTPPRLANKQSYIPSYMELEE